ncbi:MAG: 2-amino-4-hydroxy-6-hydroxymethyldihydropteridine diphosphokinase [Chloroflexota bacterium]
MHQAVISLGSNIDKEENLPEAVALLVKSGEVTAVSSVYETIPVGLSEQPTFLNAAVILHTDQTPAQLKRGILSDIERRLKRVRQTDKNAPRTIDLDITWYDDSVHNYIGPDGQPRHIPDPDLLHFAHIAVPLAELLPEGTVHPETGEPIQVLADRLLETTSVNEPRGLWSRPDIDLKPLLTFNLPD